MGLLDTDIKKLQPAKTKYVKSAGEGVLVEVHRKDTNTLSGNISFHLVKMANARPTISVDLARILKDYGLVEER